MVAPGQGFHPCTLNFYPYGSSSSCRPDIALFKGVRHSEGALHPTVPHTPVLIQMKTAIGWLRNSLNRCLAQVPRYPVPESY
jgi:hypothetical protein